MSATSSPITSSKVNASNSKLESVMADESRASITVYVKATQTVRMARILNHLRTDFVPLLMPPTCCRCPVNARGWPLLASQTVSGPGRVIRTKHKELVTLRGGDCQLENE